MPEAIKSNKVILVEGLDAKLFFMYTLKHTGKEGHAQVFDYGGITQLTNFLLNFKKIDGFEKITSILVVRDAECSASSAIQSINTSLKASQLLTKDLNPFQWHNSTPKIACMLFPGIDDSGNIIQSGTLEDLCIKLIKDQSTLNTIDSYIEDFEEKHFSFSRKHKNRLHSAISLTNDFVGMKLGEATNAMYFDLTSKAFLPF